MKGPLVLAYGELLWDLPPGGRLLGGAPANFAVRAAALGLPVALVTAVGGDPLGAEALDRIGQSQVSVELVQRLDDYPTGTVDIVFDASGNPKFTINPDVAYDHIMPRPELLRQAAQAELIYFGTLVQRSRPSRATLYDVLERGGHARKFLDINLRRDCFSPETVRESLARASILKLNVDELPVVAGLAGMTSKDVPGFCRSAIEQYDLDTCVVTRGAHGAYAQNVRGEEAEAGGMDVAVVDVIGAGDAFSAGFAWALLTGKSLQQCCDCANLLGAFACTRAGGMGALSDEELQAVQAVGEQVTAIN